MLTFTQAGVASLLAKAIAISALLYMHMLTGSPNKLDTHGPIGVLGYKSG